IRPPTSPRDVAIWEMRVEKPRADFGAGEQSKSVILAKQRYGRDDRGLVRWFLRNNPRHPSRHVLAVGAVLLAELLPQRGLFMDHHDCKREEPKEHAPRRHPFVAEQQRLAQ